jgi:hypothetical protein
MRNITDLIYIEYHSLKGMRAAPTLTCHGLFWDYSQFMTFAVCVLGRLT